MNINAAPNSLLYSTQSPLRPIGVNSLTQTKTSDNTSRQTLASEISSSQSTFSQQNGEHRRPVEKLNNTEKQNLNDQKKEALEAIELRHLIVEQNTNPAIKAFQSVAGQEDNFYIIDVYA